MKVSDHIADESSRLYFIKGDSDSYRIAVCRLDREKRANKNNCNDLFLNSRKKEFNFFAYEINHIDSLMSVSEIEKRRIPVVSLAGKPVFILSKNKAEKYFGEKYNIISLKIDGSGIETSAGVIIAGFRIPIWNNDGENLGKTWNSLFRFEDGIVSDSTSLYSLVPSIGRYLLDENIADKSEIKYYCLPAIKSKKKCVLISKEWP
jgi:hypothetical protein